jgi:AraC-like DNA-binding protein
MGKKSERTERARKKQVEEGPAKYKDDFFNDNNINEDDIIVIENDDIHMQAVFCDVVIHNSPDKRVNPQPVARGNGVYFNLVRNYLNAALGDKELAQIKLKDMQAELGMTSNTLYKHLKTLRETEFIITKRRYYTELRRRPNETDRV